MSKEVFEYCNYYDVDVYERNMTSDTTVMPKSVTPNFLIKKKEKISHKSPPEYLSIEEPDVYNFNQNIPKSSLSVSNCFDIDENQFNSVPQSHNKPSSSTKKFETNLFSTTNEIENIERKVHRKKKRRNSITSLSVSTISVYSAFAPNNKSDIKPYKRSTCQLLCNSSIMLGREFCYAVEGGMTTPILLSIGLPLHLYSLVWIISPILGFVLQPILGSLSDRCTCRWGKRRPFILGLAILLLIGMTLFLNGEQLVTLFSSQSVNRNSLSNSRKTLFAIVITVTGVVLFDFSADFIEGPIRAYAMDVCDENDVKKSLLFQAIFSGAGGAFGYASGGVAWTRDTPLKNLFATDRQAVYCASAFIFVVCCLFNLMSISEREPKKRSKQTKIGMRKEETTSKQFVFNCNKGKNSNHDLLKYFDNDNAKTITNDAMKKNQFSIEKKYNNLNRNKKKENFEINIGKRLRNNRKMQKAFRFKIQKNGKKRRNKTKSKIKQKSKKINDPHYLKESKSKKVNFCAKGQTYGTFLSQQTSSEKYSPFLDHSQSNLALEKTMKNISYARRPMTYTKKVIDGENESRQPLLGREKSGESDEDSSDSISTSFEYMLERFFPYASVDPAFNHLTFHKSSQKTGNIQVNQELTSSKKKLYPEKNPEEKVFTGSDGNSHFFVDQEQNERKNSFQVDKTEKKKSLLASIKTMPRELKVLCVCHLLGWIAFLSIALFFTDFVGQVVMKGDPRAPPNVRQNKLYNRGVEIGSWGLTINATVSCFYCVLLKLLIRKLGFRSMYVCGYFFFALGSLVIAIFPSVPVVLTSSSTIGIMSATLNTIPYMLVAQYHEEYKNRLESDVINRGVGVDCALVTCMIQLAQIFTGLGIGGLVNFFGTVTVTIAVASIFGFIGSMWALFFIKY